MTDDHDPAAVAPAIDPRNVAVQAALAAQEITVVLRSRVDDRAARRRALELARRVEAAGAVMVAEVSAIRVKSNRR
jgi:ribosomal protein S3